MTSVNESTNVSSIWYVVLQPVVLKNELNSTVTNLFPQQMIAVEKLWVLGAEQILAQVVWPIRGWVPRESRRRGQLIISLEKLNQATSDYGQCGSSAENERCEISPDFPSGSSCRQFFGFPSIEKEVIRNSYNPSYHHKVVKFFSNQQRQHIEYSNIQSDGSQEEEDITSGDSRKQDPQNLTHERSLIQRLHRIYYCDDEQVNLVHPKEKTIPNVTSLLQASDTRASKLAVETHWRYDSRRWIIVSALCRALQDICAMNKRKKKPEGGQPDMTFHSETIPDISLPDYLKRIAWFLQCSKECFVLALEYIHRLMKVRPEIELNDNSVHQLIISCIVVSAKFIDDKTYKNTFYAMVGGLPVITLSAFEIKLLFFLKFDLFILPEQLNARYETMLVENQGSSKVNIRP